MSFLKQIIAQAGGPVATLLNPNAMRAIGQNVAALIEQLPPAPVLVRAGVSLGRDALVREWTSAPPSDTFMDICRKSGKFDSDDHIIAFRNLLLTEL